MINCSSCKNNGGQYLGGFSLCDGCLLENTDPNTEDYKYEPDNLSVPTITEFKQLKEDVEEIKRHLDME